MACTVELRCTIHKFNINVNVYDLYNCLGSESGLNEYLGLLVICLCYYLTDTWSMATVNFSFKHFHILYSLVQQLLDVNRHCSIYHNGVNCKYFPSLIVFVLITTILKLITKMCVFCVYNWQLFIFSPSTPNTIRFNGYTSFSKSFSPIMTFKCILTISVYPDCLLLKFTSVMDHTLIIIWPKFAVNCL